MLMKSRRRMKSNRRNVRRTKHKVYRKSRRNTRKIMKGGAGENINFNYIKKLDDDWWNQMTIIKSFDTVDDANRFVERVKSSIGEENVTRTAVIPEKTITEIRKLPKEGMAKIFHRPSKTETVQTPIGPFKAAIATNRTAINLAKTILTEDRELNTPENYKKCVRIEIDHRAPVSEAVN